jgi:hypothetical protein
MDQALSGREQPDGETVGWVSKVEGNRIHVSAGPFGGGVMPLEVTKQTRITAGAKEGWFEDIRLGGQVKVGYEIHNGRRLARTVELLVDDGPRRPIRAEPRVKSAGTGPATERVPAKPSVATTSTPDARPAPTAKAAEPPPAVKAKVPEPVPAPPPVVSPPAATTLSRQVGSARPAPPVPPEVRPAPRPEPTRAQPVEVPPPRRGQAPPERSAAAVESGGGGDSTDGSAAVDWFLKGRR